jgi:hypothetical protein
MRRLRVAHRASGNDFGIAVAEMLSDFAFSVNKRSFWDMQIA